MIPAAAALLLMLWSSDGDLAALRFDSADDATFRISISETAGAARQIRFICTVGCPTPIDRSEPFDDEPLGLFSRDQNDLVFALAAGGSAYRVHAWRVSRDGAVKVTQLSSRGRPEILSDEHGNAVIRTYIAESGVAPRRIVDWTYRRGQFVRR